MNLYRSFALALVFLSQTAFISMAQDITRGTTSQNVTSPDTKNQSSNSSDPLDAQLADLQRRLQRLRNFLKTLPETSLDYKPTQQAILRMSEVLDELSKRIDKKESSSVPLQNAVGSKRPISPVNSVDMNKPVFRLTVPGDTLTNEATNPTVAWTADPTPLAQRNYTIVEYLVEISTERDFSFIVHQNTVKPRTVTLQNGEVRELSNSYSVPKDTLRKGIRYYWRVTARYTTSASAAPITQTAENAPFSFTTALSLFEALEDKNLKLQRTVDGPNAGKGAQFAFLTTIKGQTVFTADFALIHNRRFGGLNGYFWQSSLEGKLTSKESQSEDAWRLRTGMVIDQSFRRGGFNGLYILLGGKYEGDQKFVTKKLSFEAMVTPTIRQLAFGYAYPQNTAAPIQFMWRPYLSFDFGHTFKRGNSGETKDTVLRIVPRLTADFSLNFITRALKLSDTILYFDNTFYSLPLEPRKTRNLFVSGLEFDVTDNFGFGLTYKNGESAPKFERVNTLGGVLTVKFGQ